MNAFAFVKYLRQAASVNFSVGGGGEVLICASLREGGGIFAENDGRSMRVASLSSFVNSVIKDRFGQFV